MRSVLLVLLLAALSLAPRAAAQNAAPAPSHPHAPAITQHDRTTVWKVPLGKSPARGPRTAPVTVVVFSDFQCPFCRKLSGTLEELAKAYPNDVRVVFKHNPLPFHARAEPAAELALEALARRGEAGFWQVHDALFAGEALEDSDLAEIAKAAKLDPGQAAAAVASHKYQEAIEHDQDLAGDLEANGTPTSFVNGRKLVGAQPLDELKTLVDEEIAHAKTLVAGGTPAARVYEAIIKGGKTAPPPKQLAVAAPSKANPVRGARGAGVTIQMFTDFQCPFCGRAQTTLAEVEKRYKGRVNVVYRNMPLPMHPNARPAATVAMEAFKQKGDAGFWQMHDLLFANQRALERADLLGYAAQLGLDAAKVEAALDQHLYDAAIDADVKAANDAGIGGTPTFVVNGYELVGAQQLPAFRRVIERALAEKH